MDRRERQPRGRRDDAPRARFEREEERAYTPRTRRVERPESDSHEESSQPERPRTEPRSVSGSYRPRTGSRDWASTPAEAPEGQSHESHHEGDREGYRPPRRSEREGGDSEGYRPRVTRRFDREGDNDGNRPPRRCFEREGDSEGYRPRVTRRFDREGDSEGFRSRGPRRFDRDGDSEGFRSRGPSRFEREGGDGEGFRSRGPRRFDRDGDSEGFRSRGPRRFDRDGDSEGFRSRGSRRFDRDGDSEGFRSRGPRRFEREGDSEGFRSRGSRRFDRDGDSEGFRSRGPRRFERDGEGEGYRPRSGRFGRDEEQGGPRRVVAPRRKGTVRGGKKPAVKGNPFDPTKPMRLNRYLAHCGLCSRREADELIAAGEITVNGEVITAMGTKVIPAEVEISRAGRPMKPEKKRYVLLNKPKDCFSTTEDPHAERTVLDAIEGACAERIYPVGRLDRNTTGLILLTNDGELAEQLMHPSYNKRKIYEVELDRDVSAAELQRLAEGIELEEGVIAVDAVDYTQPPARNILGIEIHTGQNRVVRRLMDALGLRVKSLDRVYYAGLTKKDLPRGRWRHLTELEVYNLKTGRYN